MSWLQPPSEHAVRLCWNDVLVIDIWLSSNTHVHWKSGVTCRFLRSLCQMISYSVCAWETWSGLRSSSLTIARAFATKVIETLTGQCLSRRHMTDTWLLHDRTFSSKRQPKLFTKGVFTQKSRRNWIEIIRMITVLSQWIRQSLLIIYAKI